MFLDRLLARGFALAVVLFTCTASAADMLPVRRVVAFKNGLGFLTRSGPVVVDKGVATVEEIPPASYGTLWMGFTDGSRVSEVNAVTETSKSERPAVSIRDLVAANPRAQVTLALRGGSSISGSLATPPSSGAESPTTFLIESSGRFIALDSNDVLSVSFASRPGVSVPAEKTRELLRIQTDARDGRHDVSMSYLTKGIGWTPEYSVDIRPDGKATLSMRALLINDSIDLSDAEVLFAVGYPSFTFAEVPTPLDVRRSLANFFQELQRDRTVWRANALDNVMVQSVVSPRGLSASHDEGGYDSTASGVAGEAEQDLFLYSKPAVSVRKGERAAFPILTSTPSYTHVFDWEIGDAASVDAWGYRTPEQRAILADQVWHSLRIENAGTLPWTTGPAIVTERGTPLAQNTLHYTAPGASTLLRLTVAPDVLAEREEWEASRQSGALQRFGRRYDAVTLEGKLDITNRRREAITLSIRKLVTGTVASSSDEGKATKLSTRPSAVNPASRIDWNVPIAPGERKAVSYKYIVYVRD
ncbi:MAG: DUF4139 domain-containing protein [Acidobacteria bacterium]|nr:DUF4139 domain-containing protein [Acidobacteriota bacterium]